MTEEELQRNWEKDIEKVVLGKKIVKVQYMTEQDAQDNFAWYKRPIILTLEDGTELIPMADDEGNEGGSIYTTYKDLQTIPVI